MDNSIFSKKPPKEYIENFVKHIPGKDIRPELIDFVRHGYTLYDAQRMCDLLSIEALKYSLEEAKAQHEATEDEIKEVESYIAERIAKYNEAS